MSTDALILIIDNSRLMCRLMQQQLEKEGHRTITAQSVSEALHILQRESVHIVITAADLPNITELDLMVWLRAHRPEIRVMVTSATATQQLIEFVQHHKAYYLLKDSERLEELSTLVKLLLQNTALTAYGVSFESPSIRLYDVLQLMVLSKSSAILEVSQTGQNAVATQGHFYFKQGKLLHAETLAGDQTEHAGEKALRILLGLNHGSFKVLPLPETFTETLVQSFNQLISDSAQYIQTDTESPPAKKDWLPQDLRLLFVDDDPILITILQRHFQYEGFAVDVAHSAKEAIEKVKTQDYHLVLTDLNMPNMSGLEFLLSIQKYGSAAKLGVMTSHISQDLEDFLSKNGVVRLFLKPVRLDELQAFVEYMFFQNSFKGELKNMSTLDIIQTRAQGNNHIRLHILDLRTNTSGELYINAGTLEHASFGDKTAEAALQDILHVNEGVLVELAYREPEKNMSLAINSLVARQRAELEDFYAHLETPLSTMGEEISATASKIDALLNA